MLNDNTISVMYEIKLNKGKKITILKLYNMECNKKTTKTQIIINLIASILDEDFMY